MSRMRILTVRAAFGSFRSSFSSKTTNCSSSTWFCRCHAIQCVVYSFPTSKMHGTSGWAAGNSRLLVGDCRLLLPRCSHCCRSASCSASCSRRCWSCRSQSLEEALSRARAVYLSDCRRCSFFSLWRPAAPDSARTGSIPQNVPPPACWMDAGWMPRAGRDRRRR